MSNKLKADIDPEDWEAVLQGALEIGKEMEREGEKQLARLKENPNKYAAQIKFIELGLGMEKESRDALKGMIKTEKRKKQ